MQTNELPDAKHFNIIRLPVMLRLLTKWISKVSGSYLKQSRWKLQKSSRKLDLFKRDLYIFIAIHTTS